MNIDNVQVKLTEKETGEVKTLRPGRDTLILTVIQSKPLRLLDWHQYDVELVEE